MWKKIEQYQKQQKLIETGDRIVIGLSGGADSVCLLRFLCAYQEEYKLELFAVHVNHGLRGADADADEAFVGALCEDYAVPYTVVHADVAELAKQKGIGEEEAGRNLRYQAFLAECGVRGANKIAVAHHRDDNAETVLFRLFRGSFAGGLTGMQAKREIKAQDYLDHTNLQREAFRSGPLEIIRPLLDTSRQEIEEILARLQQTYCTDQTNHTLDYDRNIIRNVILKTATEQINPEASANIVRAAGQMAQMYEVIEALAKEAERTCIRSLTEQGETNGIFLSDNLKYLKKIIASEVIMRCFAAICGSKKDLGHVHVDAVYHLFDLQCGKRQILPNGMTAVRTYKGIELYKQGCSPKGKIAEERNEEAILGLDEALQILQTTKQKRTVCVGEWNLGNYPGKIRIELRKNEKNIRIPKNDCTKWFDYDKIKDTLSLRNKQTGDYLQIAPDGGRKSLKSLFIDAKIPAADRKHIPLLSAGSHVLWAIGVRSSEAFRIDEHTKIILKVSLLKNYTEEKRYVGEN